jgi:PAS domain S-box-containing protein
MADPVAAAPPKPIAWRNPIGEMSQVVAAKNWSQTPLGARETWSPALNMALELIMASGFPMALRWGPQFVLIYNDGYRPILGDKHPWALGLPASEAWAEVWEQIGPQHRAILSGESAAVFGEDVLLRIQRHGAAWDDARFALGYSPVRDETAPTGVGGIFVTAFEITERILAEEALRASEEALRESQSYLSDLLHATGEAFYAVDVTGATTLCNTAFLRILGFEREEDVLGQRLHDLIHHSHPDGSPYAKTDCPIYLGAANGEPAHVDDEVFFRLNGESFPVEYWVRPVFRDGALHGAICTFIDISERREADALLVEQAHALAENTRILEISNRMGAAIAGELDLAKVVQTVTDAGVEISGAQFGAFFYNVLDQVGESYMLYTLSGAPRSAFEQFPMPRNTAVFAPTFSGEGIVRSGDITQDPRYGHNAPRKGMPDGHLPVHSYLAAPVKSRTGEVLGGLFFGHADRDVFSEAAEEGIAGLAAQAAIAIDRARLFDAIQREVLQRSQAEADLQQLNTTLEQRVAEEVAERTKVEDALRQAQKMEAVGQLTGGVAHDFNNLLTVIMGGLDTIRRAKPGEEARIKRAADIAMLGAQRAASLTARLLAFSRRQPLQPTATDINGLVRDMTEMLHRTLGETIELEGVLAPRLWPVEVDPNQLEAAILNLAVNARDALPEGGKLTIETANTALDESYVATDAEVLAGQYVVICVSDNGVGMSQETLARVFEPFFTTKEVGKGTGLGLSMVYGFVKQSGGHVVAYSEEGQGTTIKLYLPRHLGGHAAVEPTATQAPAGQGDEVILVVEDNDDVRAFSVMILRELGYTVLEAAEAEAALRILDQAGPVDLLFTDVVLPGKSGRVLADAAAQKRPGLPVLFTTGYSRNAIVHHGRLDVGVQLLGKPFTYEQLATRVRDILDGAKRGG